MKEVVNSVSQVKTNGNRYVMTKLTNENLKFNPNLITASEKPMDNLQLMHWLTNLLKKN